MYIPLKTSVYIVNRERCSDIYSSLDYAEEGIRLLVDESMLCAGLPAAKQSIMHSTEGGANDACNVSQQHQILFSSHVSYLTNPLET